MVHSFLSSLEQQNQEDSQQLMRDRIGKVLKSWMNLLILEIGEGRGGKGNHGMGGV